MQCPLITTPYIYIYIFNKITMHQIPIINKNLSGYRKASKSTHNLFKTSKTICIDSVVPFSLSAGQVRKSSNYAPVQYQSESHNAESGMWTSSKRKKELNVVLIFVVYSNLRKFKFKSNVHLSWVLPKFKLNSIQNLSYSKTKGPNMFKPQKTQLTQQTANCWVRN
jgi:hypothetical protein